MWSLHCHHWKKIVGVRVVCIQTIILQWSVMMCFCVVNVNLVVLCLVTILDAGSALQAIGKWASAETAGDKQPAVTDEEPFFGNSLSRYIYDISIIKPILYQNVILFLSSFRRTAYNKIRQ